MKSLWPIAFVISFAWACIITYKYAQVKSNPVVMSVSTVGVDSEVQNLSKMERLSFIRQFVDKYISFEADTFWQEQTALSFLMSPELRDLRLVEINRLKEKIQKNHTIQKGRILSIQERHDGYLIQIEMAVAESKDVAQLNASLFLKLQETTRSLENPWGLAISDLQFTPIEKAVAYSGDIQMKVGYPSILHFPCAVENLELPPDLPLKVKITTLNVSEIQLYLSEPHADKISLKALCKEQEFALSISMATESTDVFSEVPFSFSQRRASLVKEDQKQKKKSAYKKTIENELGFIIEE